MSKLLMRLILVIVLCLTGHGVEGQDVHSLLFADTLYGYVSSVPDSPVDKIVANNNGEYVFAGRVTDSITGLGIPFAIIYLLHTNTGTTADGEGYYSLQTEGEISDSIHFEALGYKAVNRVINKDVHDIRLNVALERSAHELNEVTVKGNGEDPALVLIRHIIEHKPRNNPDRWTNYSYEAYNRLEADMQGVSKEEFAMIPIFKNYTFLYDILDTVSEKDPFLPVYLTETISDYYFRSSPKKQREYIKASMMKGVKNENVLKYLGTMYQNINVYRNFLPVFDKKFVSPISNDGPFYYKYTIIDTQQAYGHRILVVNFRPRREGENCFSGNFRVADTSFALQSINMDVPRLANLNWVDRVSISQEFAPTDTTWFCIKDQFIARFSPYNIPYLPAFIGRKTTTYHNIKPDDPGNEKMLNNREWGEDVIKSDSAKIYDNDWWQHNRPDSLTKNEKAINNMVDSINSMPITTFYKNLITFLASGVKDFGWLELGPYYYLYSSNPVEGSRFRLSFGSARKFKDVHFTGFVAYGTADKAFKYGASGLWIMERHPRTYLYGYYTHDLYANTNYYGDVGADNIFSGLFRKPGIPWKQAFTDDKRLEYYKQYFSGFSHSFVVEATEFTPYAPLPGAGIFQDGHGNLTTSVKSTEASVELRYAYKEKYIDGLYQLVNLGSKYPVVKLTVTTGVPYILGSAYQYLKGRFSINESINIPPLGHLDYVVYAGQYIAPTALPYPLLEIHPGNEYLYYNPNAFEMMNLYEFLSDRYAGINIDHNIGGGIFNHIPLLKKMKLRQFWTAKGIIGSLSPQNQQLNLDKGFPFRTLQGNPYLELGTGISNILQVMRIDFVWRVAPQPLPSESKSRYFGIFVSANFQF